MLNLLNSSVSAPNIVPTALLVSVLIYWLVVIVGAMGRDFFNIAVDVDADAGVDGEISVLWFNRAMAFFHGGWGCS